MDQSPQVPPTRIIPSGEIRKGDRLSWPHFRGHLKKGTIGPGRCPMAKRPQYTKEFKLEAVRLWKSSGRPAAAVARELGLRRNHLYKWQHEIENFGDAAFPGKGGRAHSTDELTRLRRENGRLREERDILKKAAAFFARESP